MIKVFCMPPIITAFVMANLYWIIAITFSEWSLAEWSWMQKQALSVIGGFTFMICAFCYGALLMSPKKGG